MALELPNWLRPADALGAAVAGSRVASDNKDRASREGIASMENATRQQSIAQEAARAAQELGQRKAELDAQIKNTAVAHQAAQDFAQQKFLEYQNKNSAEAAYRGILASLAQRKLDQDGHYKAMEIDAKLNAPVPTYIPKIEAQDADVTPASGGSWNPFNWGAGAHPAVTNSPAISAVPGHYERLPIKHTKNLEPAIPVGGFPNLSSPVASPSGTSGFIIPTAGGTSPHGNGFVSPAVVAAANPTAESVDGLNQTKNPTRSIAADYVNKYGKSDAMKKLQDDGFDVSRYAD